MTTAIIVDERLSEIKSEICQHLKRQWEDVLAIGKLAIEAKGLIPHGGFINWIKEDLRLSPSLIQGYMRVYMRFSNTESLRVLPISGLLLLASPSVSDGLIAEVGSRIGQGEKFTVEGIDNMIDRYRILEGAKVGSQALLANYGTKPDGTLAKVISRSAITSLEAVASDGLQRGAVTIEGLDIPVTMITLPPAIVAAVAMETKHRQSEHIDDNSVRVSSEAVVSDIPEDDALREMGYVTLRVLNPEALKQLKRGQTVALYFKVKE